MAGGYINGDLQELTVLITIELDNCVLSAHNSASYNWLAAVKWSGDERTIEYRVNLYFDHSATIDSAIAQLQKLKHNFVS